MDSHHCTVSSVVAFFPRKNQREAIKGPAKEATPWKPWLKLRRAAAYFGVPSTEMYEFAATSRQLRPHPGRKYHYKADMMGNAVTSSPITKVQPTNPPYARNFADGQKKIAPVWCRRFVRSGGVASMGKMAYRESRDLDRDGYLSDSGDVGYLVRATSRKRTHLVSIFLHLSRESL